MDNVLKREMPGRSMGPVAIEERRNCVRGSHQTPNPKSVIPSSCTFKSMEIEV